MTRYLTLEALLQIVADLRVGPVRDMGLLDSAVARPRSSAFGTEAYPTLGLKTAALMHSITANHALIDGNKRLAWTAGMVMLGINGHRTSLNQDDAYKLMIAIATGTSDLAWISETLAIVVL